MPAGHQERDRGGRQWAVLELVHGDVRGQVIDAVQRLVQRHRVGLRRGDPDQQRAGQAGPGRHGDRVHRGQLLARGREGALHRRDHRLQVGAARHLGHHPAEPGVLVHARRHRVGQQFAAADQPGARLVAGRLDAEHERGGHDRRPGTDRDGAGDG